VSNTKLQLRQITLTISVALIGLDAVLTRFSKTKKASSCFLTIAIVIHKAKHPTIVYRMFVVKTLILKLKP
jgi:hypothetical protein